MVKGFELDVDKNGKITLRRAVDLSHYLKANYEEKKAIGRGFSQKKAFRKVGSIPVDVLLAYGIDVRDTEAVKDFLKKHPEYRVSEGQI